MGSYIKWEDCDKWADDFNPRTGKIIPKAHHITRELVCSRPEVEKAWFHGPLSMKPESRPILSFEMIMKNGERFAMHDIPVEYHETGHIPNAEAFLQSINTDTL